MKRRHTPDDLDDTKFQVIHVTRHGRRHLILVPPTKPEYSTMLHETHFFDLEPKERFVEPEYNWLSIEAMIGILDDTLIYPYVEIDGVRIENSYADDKMQESVQQMYASLEKLEELCKQGHEDDKSYLKNVYDLTEHVSECAIDSTRYMLKAGFRAGLRLGQKLREEDLSEYAQEW